MSNLTWSDRYDDEKYYESDKFTEFDELAYKAGIDTAPEKAPDQDKEYLKRVERHEDINSAESRLGRAALIAEHMDYAELKTGKMKTQRGEITTQGQYHTAHKSHNTHGKYLSNITEEERDYQDKQANFREGDIQEDSDDDLFKDDDEDFQRQLDSIRQERIRTIKEHSLRTGQSVHVHDMGRENDEYEKLRTLPCLHGVKQIVPEEYEQEVQHASKDGVVLMLVYKANNRASEIMLNCLNQLALRLRVKICVIMYSEALSHVPEQHCPILMCYEKQKVLGSFAKLDHFHGSKTTALDIEWKLAECGIIQTDLQEDPRDAALFD